MHPKYYLLKVICIRLKCSTLQEIMNEYITPTFVWYRGEPPPFNTTGTLVVSDPFDGCTSLVNEERVRGNFVLSYIGIKKFRC
jgi:hypothetical protein